jgi:NTP pyrophosphatase (non-canonical NTP hydrolase)
VTGPDRNDEFRVPLERRSESIRIHEQTVEIGEWRRSKEFFTPDAAAFEEPAPLPLTNADAMLGKLMLVVTELAEAAEACRKGDYQNFCEEVGDAVIRLMDICDAGQIDLAGEIRDKMRVNWTRPIKHGKKNNL